MRVILDVRRAAKEMSQRRGRPQARPASSTGSEHTHAGGKVATEPRADRETVAALSQLRGTTGPFVPARALDDKLAGIGDLPSRRDHSNRATSHTA
jgi:hypothetical protein